MWRDFSRSTFIFGIGTFLIFSSSYAKDINLRLENQTKCYLIINILYTLAVAEETPELKFFYPCFCSLISVISYIGLVYLAVIFLYRALICR